MSGTFPTTPPPSSIVLRSLQPTRVSVAHNLKRQVRGGTSQQWAFDLDWSMLARSQLAPILAFAMAQKGQYETFTFIPPVLGTAQAAASGTVLVNGATASGRSVQTDGWAISQTVLKAGDFVKFASHNKVYMLTADAVSNVSGQATLSIEPALYASVADNSAVTHTNVPFTVAMGSDTQEVGVTAPFITNYACKLIEVV